MDVYFSRLYTHLNPKEILDLFNSPVENKHLLLNFIACHFRALQTLRGKNEVYAFLIKASFISS